MSYLETLFPLGFPTAVKGETEAWLAGTLRLDAGPAVQAPERPRGVRTNQFFPRQAKGVHGSSDEGGSQEAAVP